MNFILIRDAATMLDRLQNIVYDTNYITIVADGGFVVIPQIALDALAQTKQKKSDFS